MSEQRECAKCPAFIWSDESLRTGLCHGCRSPGPEMVVETPPWPAPVQRPDPDDWADLDPSELPRW